MTTRSDVEARIEETVRASYGRLLAILASSTSDIVLAEDVLAEALARALEVWPTKGVPDNPESWLITVARNKHRDDVRSASARTSQPLTVDPEVVLAEVDPDVIPDKRLSLMFACAHPAVSANVRTALILQTILGLEAKDIGQAFLVPEATIAQRLVRAKRRIKETQIPFKIPDRREMPERLDAVLEAIYGAYSAGYPLPAGLEVHESLAGEALYLACTVAELLSGEAEAQGLAALICLSMARQVSSRDPKGAYIPLADQDTSTWDRTLIFRGEGYLAKAASLGSVGRFQLEAAIQSAHCERGRTGTTNWDAVEKLYAGLVGLSPILGAQISYGAVVMNNGRPEEALRYVESLDNEAVQRFQPYWVLRGHLFTRLGKAPQAEESFTKAISLTTDPASRTHLETLLVNLTFTA
ncbi:MAG: hypothetical protein LBG99_04665 [Propionibacteriaceae bacterium]|nr:hypothetical protein [Propionibacteriaceae bacterium]